MKKFIILSLLLVLGGAVGAFAQNGGQPPSPDDQLLGQMDYERFGAYFDLSQNSPSSSFTVDVTAQRVSGTFTATVQVSFKLIKGNFYGRIDYLAPSDLAQQVFIITPEGIFFWKPDLAETGAIRVPGSYEVFGDATVAEVVGIGFRGDYKIGKRDDNVTLTDHPGKTYIRLSLEPAHDGVAFPYATVVAEAITNGDKTTYLPYTLELFGVDHKDDSDALHFNTFEEYGDLNGTPFFKTQNLHNLITPENYTRLSVSNILHEEIPDAKFDPAQLGK
ncbi:hypothetical protein HY229_06365 [Candidatus Acetothermia bacterium]|nr:hypothetical protein [Candidatus Acetothermia bacterium]MBI3643705.1 hypothetical protein [Candidatus Acetothermia bacterium]